MIHVQGAGAFRMLFRVVSYRHPFKVHSNNCPSHRRNRQKRNQYQQEYIGGSHSGLLHIWQMVGAGLLYGIPQCGHLKSCRIRSPPAYALRHTWLVASCNKALARFSSIFLCGISRHPCDDQMDTPNIRTFLIVTYHASSCAGGCSCCVRWERVVVSRFNELLNHRHGICAMHFYPAFAVRH